MKYLALLLVLLPNGSIAFGQQLFPHLFTYAGPELMGGGYRSVAGDLGAGFRIDSQRFLFDASASYDNGRKTNDGTGSNPHGHDRTPSPQCGPGSAVARTTFIRYVVNSFLTRDGPSLLIEEGICRREHVLRAKKTETR